MATSYVSMIRTLRNLENKFLNWFGSNIHPGFPGAVACDVTCTPYAQKTTDGCEKTDNPKSILDSIFDGTLWAAVPKFRRSREKRMMRKFGFKKHMEYVQPKKNIVACLDCGSYHESNAICGVCYDKVRKETETMKEAMGEETLKYDFPRQEIKFLYKGEEAEKAMHDGKYIVELDRPRPDWFPKHLMNKNKG